MLFLPRHRYLIATCLLLALSLSGCVEERAPEEQEATAASSRVVVDRLLEFPALAADRAEDAEEAGVQRMHLDVDSFQYPATPPLSEFTWSTELMPHGHLGFGVYSKPDGELQPVEVVVEMATASSPRRVVLQQRVEPRDLRSGVVWIGKEMPKEGGSATLYLSARNPENGQPSELTWVNPRIFGQVPRRSPPNVLILLVDTLRADRLRATGGETSAMPLLDQRLEGEGLKYTNAYANAAWSLPSMASLLTGRLPGFQHTGRRTYLGKEDKQFNLVPRETQGGIELVVGGSRFHFQMLHHSIPTLQEILGNHGYSTAAIYNNGYINHPTRVLKGMDMTHHYGLIDASTGSDAALNWLEDQRDRPFFLFLHYMDVHEWRKRAERNHPGWSARPYREEDRQRFLDAYDELAIYTDRQIERVLETLDTWGVLDDTIVVLTSDHGEAFFEEGGYVGHGDSSRDLVLHVPLALWGPGVPHGQVDGRVQLADVAPTVLDLVGIASEPYDMDGKSLLLNGGGPDTRDRTVVSEFNLGAIDSVVVYQGPWRLVHYPQHGVTRLYRADADVPAEEVSDKHREVVDDLLALVERYQRSSQQHRQSLEYGKTRIDDETLQSLRALGYID